MRELYKIVFYGFSKDAAIDIDNKIKTKLGIMNGSIEHDDRFDKVYVAEPYDPKSWRTKNGN